MTDYHALDQAADAGGCDGNQLRAKVDSQELNTAAGANIYQCSAQPPQVTGYCEVKGDCALSTPAETPHHISRSNVLRLSYCCDNIHAASDYHT